MKLKSLNLKSASEAGSLTKQALTPSKLSKRSRRRLVRWSLITGNIVLLLVVAGFVLANRSASQTVRTSTLNSAAQTAGAQANPLDQLSAAQIALTAAQMAKLPELTAVRNQADSDSLMLSVVPNDSTTLTKPLVVSTAEKSKQDIVHYTTVSGDTVTSLSAKYGITPASIRWSNNISGDAIAAGTALVIPPVNGIVYTVRDGDTPANLAARYQSDQDQIIGFNDAEISGLTTGEQIVIPNGQIAPVVRANPAAFFLSAFTATYGGNGYDFGYCTWYVANRIAVPTNWGNANTWDDYARLSGWTVSTVPIPGAIAQTDRGFEGHVGVVESVSADGSQIIYSDMNGLAGWGRVGYSGLVPATTFQHYIYH